MKIYLILALVAAVLGYPVGLDYMAKRGPVMIPEGVSSKEVVNIHRKFDHETQVGALVFAGYGVVVVTGALILGMGLRTLLIRFGKVPAAFREGYRDGKP